MNINDLHVKYDKSINILSITIDGAVTRLGTELDPKIMWQYQLDHKLAGVTIIDFTELSADSLYDLAEEFVKGSNILISQFLDLVYSAI